MNFTNFMTETAKKPFVFIGAIFLLLLLVIIYNPSLMKENNNMKNQSELANNSMLLVLAAPSIHNEYYEEYFDEIVNFQTNYAKKVLETKTDNIRILVDGDTEKYYSKNLPKDILINQEMYDIWMRDFTTINPENPIQFVYTSASMTKAESQKTQKLFNNYVGRKKIEFNQTKYILDGGNIVDNYKGKIITTTRFLKDNDLEYEEAKYILKDLLGAGEVAIIEPDDDVLAHSDGMVAWIDDNVLAVNDYSLIDREFHNIVLDELKYSFPNTKIIIVPVDFDEYGGVDQTKGIGSACGVHLNLVATYKHLYVPVFGNEMDEKVIEVIKNNTSKKVITINAENICLFGGSVRCTTWQIAGNNADKIIR